MRFDLNVNGHTRTVETDRDRPLLEVLREDLDLTGAKYGCGEGACRACTVLLDGEPVTSCRLPVERAAGREILTIEGLAEGDRLHPVQQAFLETGAMQCGYCVPGMILTTVALLAEHPRPTREQTVAALDGNLCRCCGYTRMLEAVEVASRGPGEPSVSAEAGS
ncbi:MAG TPA: (2Fe-2S)-binding protein [Thermoanaerobaculia bacterium]|nr:(2Fe-2S)-binding protein [Thermoanaerobaculia bacterium]